MTRLSGALAALVGYLLLGALAVAGIAVAVFCAQGGTASLSPAHAAELLSLGELRDTVGPWLADLEADGPSAAVAAICGAGAVLLGLVLVLGALVPRRDRLFLIEEGTEGRLTARRRALAAALAYLAERPRDVLGAKVRVRPNRRGRGGRARLSLLRSRSQDGSERATEAVAELEHLEGELALRPRVRNRVPRRGGRVV